MRTDQLLARHPEVFHVAAEESWASIQTHGLCSTARLLDLHQVDESRRDALLRSKRTHSTRLSSPDAGVAIIRDQKPLKFIEQKISPNSSLPRFLESLNSRVYFAPDRDRLERLLRAREYRGSRQVVLTVDTARLVGGYQDQIELCRFNSGACTQVNHPVRGHDSWQSIGNYPYDENRRRYGVALVEVTVQDEVPNICELTTRVEHIVA